MKKGEFIIKYVGEILTNNEAELRENNTNIDKAVYIFYIADDVKLFYIFKINWKLIIDAKYIGNKARYINHDMYEPNVMPRVFFSFN